MTKKEELNKMTIIELYCYNNLIKQQIDSCLIRLRTQLTDIEAKEMNQKRLKYNQIIDAVQEEINKRIFSLSIQ